MDGWMLPTSRLPLMMAERIILVTESGKKAKGIDRARIPAMRRSVLRGLERWRSKRKLKIVKARKQIRGKTINAEEKVPTNCEEPQELGDSLLQEVIISKISSTSIKTKKMASRALPVKDQTA